MEQAMSTPTSIVSRVQAANSIFLVDWEVWTDFVPVDLLENTSRGNDFNDFFSLASLVYFSLRWSVAAVHTAVNVARVASFDFRHILLEPKHETGGIHVLWANGAEESKVETVWEVFLVLWRYNIRWHRRLFAIVRDISTLLSSLCRSPGWRSSF